MSYKPIAEVLLTSARHNRVEAMKVRSRLITLRDEYDKLYGHDRP